MIVFAVPMLRWMKSHDPQTCSKFNMCSKKIMPYFGPYVVSIYHNKIINYDITPGFCLLLAPRKLPMLHLHLDFSIGLKGFNANKSKI